MARFINIRNSLSSVKTIKILSELSVITVRYNSLHIRAGYAPAARHCMGWHGPRYVGPEQKRQDHGYGPNHSIIETMAWAKFARVIVLFIERLGDVFIRWFDKQMEHLQLMMKIILRLVAAHTNGVLNTVNAHCKNGLVKITKNLVTI